MILDLSTTISRSEKLFSVYLEGMDVRDALAGTLRARITELLGKRPDLSRADFGKAIGRPTASWLSEFFNGQRTTNNLRLVIRIARFFRVPVSYLLNDDAAPSDAATLTLLGAWGALDRQQDRDAVLNLALTLRPDSPAPPLPETALSDGVAEATHSQTRVAAPMTRRRRETRRQRQPSP